MDPTLLKTHYPLTCSCTLGILGLLLGWEPPLSVEHDPVACPGVFS
jgi:hypothetical protein